MRQFRLLADGKAPLALTTRTAFFRAPSGLGTQRTITYYDSNGFFIRESNRQAQQKIAGEIVFRENSYGSYRDVADWLVTAQNMRIGYRAATGEREYFCDVDLEYINKSELSTGKWLVCPVSFIRRSPWYTTESQRITFANTGGGNKRYTYRYGYRYSLGFAGGEAEVYLEAQTPGGFGFVAEGPMVGPYLQVSNADTGEVYGKVSLPGVTFTAAERLEYASNPTAPYIRKVGPNGVEDMRNALDLTSRNWFAIPVHTRCRITLYSGTAEINGTVTIYRYWEAI